MARTVAIDDLPASESVSGLRAAGVITSDTAVTNISFGDQSFNVAISHRVFPWGRLVVLPVSVWSSVSDSEAVRGRVGVSVVFRGAWVAGTG
jgi:hypothetical protein